MKNSTLLQRANETVMNGLCDGLSDIESHSKEWLKEWYGKDWTAEHEVKYANGSHAVEWDGWYGKHWESFTTEADMNARLDEYSADIEAKVQVEYKRLLKVKVDNLARFKASRNTLGNLFPELVKLV